MVSVAQQNGVWQLWVSSVLEKQQVSAQYLWVTRRSRVMSPTQAHGYCSPPDCCCYWLICDLEQVANPLRASVGTASRKCGGMKTYLASLLGLLKGSNETS